MGRPKDKRTGALTLPKLSTKDAAFESKDSILLKSTCPVRDSTQNNIFRSKSSLFEKAQKLRLTFAQKDFYQKYIDANDLVQIDAIKSVTKAFGLTPKQLKKLYRRFNRIDFDGSGSIQRKELFAVLQEVETLVTDAFFRLMDSGDKGNIDFHDFMRVCSTYCIYTRRDILKFCFDCFDVDACK
jgi:hypothetical protein